MFKHTSLIALLVGASLAIGFARPNQQSEPQTVQMWAVSFGDRPRVEFRWIPEEGWLPEGGYNMYRIEGEKATRINDRPIVPDADALAKDPELKAMLTTAARPLSSAAQVQLKAMLSGSKTKMVSTAPEFREARTEAAAAISAKTGKVTGRIRARIDENPKIKRIVAVRAPRKEEQRLRSKSAVPSVNNDETIQDARDSLRMTALLKPGAAQMLGMAFTDERASAGQMYYYELRAINQGQETLAVRTRLTVGKDAALAPPVVENPIQLGQTEVGLHFAAISQQDSIEHGLLQYNVYRVVAGKRELLNGDKPILQSYAPTSDGKLQEHLLTFTDSKAPARQTFSYEVESIDIFGRKASTIVACTMADLAEPLEQPVPACVGPLDRNKPIKSKPDLAVTVYWVPAVHTTEDTPASIAVEGKGAGRQNWEKISYTVERIDAEASSPIPIVVSGGQPIDGTLITDYSELTVGTMFRLYPGIANAAKSSMRTDTNKNGMTEDSPASDLFNRTKYPTLPQWRLPVLKLVDTEADADRYYAYRLTPVLMRNGRNGVPQMSSQVGVPALIMPASPTNVAQTNVLAPTTEADFQTLKSKGSLTNASRRQLAPGRLTPQGKVTNQASMGPKKAAIQVKEAAGLGVKLTAQKLSTVVGVPTNYGRVVTLNWQAPQYFSPVFYRVYRAIATGYRTATGETTSIGFRADIPIEEFRGNESKSESSGGGTKKKVEVAPTLQKKAEIAPDLAQKKIEAPKQGVGGLEKRPALKRGAGLAGSAGKFMGEYLPATEEYTLLGSTKDAETTFIDLVPRSQAMTYYYVVEPVNRWGQPGARSAPMKAMLDPSLNPSVPIVEAVSAMSDGTVTVNVATNLDEERVTKYEVYRLEVPMPPKPVHSSNPANAVGPKFATVGVKTAKEASTSTQKGAQAADPNSAKTRFGVGARPEHSVETKTLQTSLFTQKPVGAVAKQSANKQLDLSSYTLVATLVPDANTGGTILFPDPSVEGGKAYVYCVVAINVADLKSDPTLPYDGIPVKVVADPPTVVLGTTPFVEATNTITFTINRPASGANAYLIERSSDGGTTWKDLGARESMGASTLVDDKPVLAGRTYLYRVYAVDYVGNVSIAAEVIIVT